jgi:hypothetical protein
MRQRLRNTTRRVARISSRLAAVPPIGNVVGGNYVARMTGAELLQMAVAILSVPAVAAAISWLARRFSKESRLIIRLERLAAILPNLPEGKMRDEFGNRVAEAGAELNARLDPLFKQERRRKRKVIAGVMAVAAFLVLIYPGQRLLESGWSNAASVALGFMAVGAFFLIERDTHKQRAAIRAEQDVEGHREQSPSPIAAAIGDSTA